jgi:hypothetical protein
MGIPTGVNNIEFTVKFKEGPIEYPLITLNASSRFSLDRKGWFPTIKLALDEFMKLYPNKENLSQICILQKESTSSFEEIEVPKYLIDLINKKS